MNNINIVLVEPEIPQNTGTIGRLAVSTDAVLHLVDPLGFSLEDKYLKRAGLDYWDSLDVTYYECYGDFLDKNRDGEMYFFSSHAKRSFSDVDYPEGSYLVFGRESVGLPRELVTENIDRAVRIPMREGQRCLNLSNSVAVAVYEVLRQCGYAGLK